MGFAKPGLGLRSALRNSRTACFVELIDTSAAAIARVVVLS
jgi:hypothetical protein